MNKGKGCIVTIDNKSWNTNGGKMMKWIDNHISENCYKIKFGKFGQPIQIVFDTATNATFFRMILTDIAT